MHSTSPCQQPHHGTAVLLAQGLIDLQGLWRVYNPKYKNYTGMSTGPNFVACTVHPADICDLSWGCACSPQALYVLTGFGQDFLAKHLLGWPTDGASHDAVGDAIKSLRLYRLHQQLSADRDRLAQTQARASCTNVGVDSKAAVQHARLSALRAGAMRATT